MYIYQLLLFLAMEYVSLVCENCPELQNLIGGPRSRVPRPLLDALAIRVEGT